MKEDMIGGFIVGGIVFTVIIAIYTSILPKSTVLYRDGVKSIQREAFEKGFMKKDVDKDDKVLYKWIELEKQ